MLALAGSGIAAAPPACGGAEQIVDAVGDGHHLTTDVQKAWFAEAPGSLQAVISVSYGNWFTDHLDDGSEQVGFALVYSVAGNQRYVRILAPTVGAIEYDYGSFAAPGSFISEGSTTGSVTYGVGGHGVIDIPTLPAGTAISKPYVLTWDGIESGLPHWVDRAPGGVAPSDGPYGADFVVGTCVPGALGPDSGVLATRISARSSIRGEQKVTIRGSVTPAVAGVPVSIRLAAKKRRTLHTTTAADGTFSTATAIRETSTLSATAGSRTSGAIVVRVRSKTRIRLTRNRNGSVVVQGTTDPALPGHVLLLRAGDYRSTARARVRAGRFTIRLRRPRKGSYEAVYIPQMDRAERSTSNKGLIR